MSADFNLTGLKTTEDGKDVLFYLGYNSEVEKNVYQSLSEGTVIALPNVYVDSNNNITVNEIFNTCISENAVGFNDIENGNSILLCQITSNIQLRCNVVISSDSIDKFNINDRFEVRVGYYLNGVRLGYTNDVNRYVKLINDYAGTEVINGVKDIDELFVYITQRQGASNLSWCVGAYSYYYGNDRALSYTEFNMGRYKNLANQPTGQVDTTIPGGPLSSGNITEISIDDLNSTP
ncbi:MAG: hypothetical protein NC200_02650 [Candidatus Gastranaerophilales bacterium]|nr:hypothetical protein [Candidatus Gastranaerophilales bacterium]